MKEKEYDNKIKIKKEKIFNVQILNKKRKPDNSNVNDFKQSPKKKMFILYKPSIDLNNKQNLLKKNINENLINNLNIINKKNSTKNINLLTIKNNTTNNNNDKIIDKNIGKNIILENQINNNKLTNNIKVIKNLDKTESTKNENETQVEYGEYICFKENQIGSGSFGEVLYGKHKNTNLEVAVKIINSETSIETIRREINYTKQLQGINGFPTIYYTGIHDNKNIIVESLLGPSLDKLFKYCERIFPLKTVCLIGKEMVKRLESMHEKGLLHRDLKPNNLTWGNYNSSYNNIFINDSENDYNYQLDINTIYLIDFGLSCSFYENGSPSKHYKLKDNLNFVGTLRYASLNSHKGIRQGRRDDLESMLYILIYFLKGKLPWQDVKAKQKEERHKLIYEKKSKTTIEYLCKDLPIEFAELLKYVKSLRFDEKPLYCKFYAYFHNLITKINNEIIQVNNFNYIWEKKIVDNMNKYESKKDEEIILAAEKIIFKGYPINLNNFTNYIIYSNKRK
jgi:serine/threonine protein kinase